jgi:lipopolysaccharide/colanic/teichoic acid biosynthesis glycosyltransferase
METLTVRPGLASPGSIYNYTHGEKLIGQESPERDYVERLLPVKLALEQVYVRNASFSYDLRVIFRTIWVIARIACGKAGGDPPEMAKIDRVVPARNTKTLQPRND